MRRRSSTTSSATQTYTARRGRTVSVSTVFHPTLSPSRHRRTRHPVDLLSLPNEILFKIIITAARPAIPTNKFAYRLVDSDDDEEDDLDVPRLEYRTLRNIALACRRLNDFASTIMYSAVSVRDVRTARLFARTVVGAAHEGGISLSPVSPTVTTASSPWSSRPRPVQEGKNAYRLALEYPFWDKRQQQRHSSEFLQASMGAILGFGPSAPSFPSPVLSSLRTLLIDARILEYHMSESPSPSPTWAIANEVSPRPSELVLSTYLRASSLPFGSAPLAPLATRLTHLIIASSPPRWCLPSTTTKLLGALHSLTHLALPRKANANEDNDLEFIDDIRALVQERQRPYGSLECLVLVVEPYSGFLPLGTSSDSSSDVDKESSIYECFASTHIWRGMTGLAREVNTQIAYSRGRPTVCVIPGSEGAWHRALSKHRQIDGVFDSNVFSNDSRGRDLWSWAQEYECTRWLSESAPCSS